jgi:hypothetical protein
MQLEMRVERTAQNQLTLFCVTVNGPRLLLRRGWGSPQFKKRRAAIPQEEELDYSTSLHKLA